MSTKTIRHYHKVGLLSEPARLANRYRRYTVRDAVRLARIRRLTELGLSLAETREALAADEGRGLTELLGRLAADLERQERELRERRLRLLALVRGDADEPVAELARVLTDAFPGSATAGRDRDYLTVLARRISPELVAWCRNLLRDPDLVARLRPLYRRFDELAGAPEDDPRIPLLAKDITELIPAGSQRHPLAAAAVVDLPPAHARLLDCLLARWLPG
ncbi:MerR family transcriptional regulator [Crossiella sp. CA-258035]|uniref:MerR family transcriptional regulator n=1 Tax=Crossiella sp. CA-258035 TaxID=2981138 RepID=UPI0024BC28C2|nr:MerR family transcriptional regulator [Crossiella sp. CA-258035]WHT22895.1 MerR family transcriptional regulator [Crossiella sp. CA-258035]